MLALFVETAKWFLSYWACGLVCLKWEEQFEDRLLAFEDKFEETDLGRGKQLPVVNHISYMSL